MQKLYEKISFAITLKEHFRIYKGVEKLNLYYNIELH